MTMTRMAFATVNVILMSYIRCNFTFSSDIKNNCAEKDKNIVLKKVVQRQSVIWKYILRRYYSQSVLHTYLYVNTCRHASDGAVIVRLQSNSPRENFSFDNLKCFPVTSHPFASTSYCVLIICPAKDIKIKISISTALYIPNT